MGVKWRPVTEQRTINTLPDATDDRDEHSTNPFDSSNPYGARASMPSRYAEGDIQLAENQQRGLVGHIPVIGILMIVQGVLVMSMAVFIGVYAVFMPQFFEEMRRDMAAQGAGGAAMPPEFGTWFMVVGALIAATIGIVAVTTVLSGIKLLKFRGRTFAIVTLCCGMLTFATCYCFPTALALGVYGLIVLLNGPVTVAMGLSEQGYDPREIQRAFLTLP